MKNGIYRANFRVGGNWGVGMVVIRDGHIAGGDLGFTYVGSYSDNGGDLEGTLEVQQHDASVDNVFAGLKQFALTFTGQTIGGNDGVAQLQGTTVSAPGAQTVIDLSLVREL